MSGPIAIDIWSDIACPWCYIGKRRLESGLAEYAASEDAVPVEITYHSFELAPETPVDFAGGVVDHLVKAKGLAPAQVQQMLERVTGLAADEGLDYHFENVQHTNTVKAHQLLHLAKAHGLQLEMKERLLKAYFEQGRHVGHVEDLADLAVEVGLDRDEVVRELTADTYLDAVHADQAQARAYGINGVPFFVIDGKYGVSGAQEPATFVEVLSTVARERAGLVSQS
ncbi:thioredoxin domain-containing protein [Nakamurella sp. YIM 132087]|uniref:Thioredoxin domain-containing protein n=1 Tax=Nakamurella alba TaxID=2665158 RepID=A0A7K1FKU0_9ACTN|nr:DsbA family oxidoreductase [Nakamurella alba]MTD14755.1 thioredoxin domain-containing protein [Nakamurella alba]